MTRGYTKSASPTLEQGSNGLKLTDAGMTLRDYFAGQAIGAVYREFWQGVRNREHASDERWREGIAIDAYWIADAMLAMRSAKVTMTAEPDILETLEAIREWLTWNDTGDEGIAALRQRVEDTLHKTKHGQS